MQGIQPMLSVQNVTFRYDEGARPALDGIFLPGMETLEPFNIIYQTAEDGLGDTVSIAFCRGRTNGFPTVLLFNLPRAYRLVFLILPGGSFL